MTNHVLCNNPSDSDEFRDQLNQHRAEIDAIDTQLLALFDERTRVVECVGHLKAEHNVVGSYVRPGREATMLRDLMNRAQLNGSRFPQSAIAAIWRIIIGSSTAVESPLNTITFDDDPEAVHVSAHYFGLNIPHRSANIDAFFAHLEQDRHAIAVVPYNLEASWWQRMPDPMRVFACLPFVGGNPTHLALGHVTPEATGDDVSLFYHYDSKHVSINHGFHTIGAPLSDIPSNALYIGSYASPYIL